MFQVLVTLLSTQSKNCKALGAKAVTASDSAGCDYDKDGIDVELLKEIKEVKRERIVKYAEARPNAEPTHRRKRQFGQFKLISHSHVQLKTNYT